MAKSKEIDGLDCNTSLPEGIRLVLTTRMEEMCSYAEIIPSWSDIEDVHDMRVASRRLRSALNDFKPFLSKQIISHFQKQIRLTARSLGMVRDKDVAIQRLEELQPTVPDNLKSGIDIMIEKISREREKARTSLLQVMEDLDLSQLREDFIDALGSEAAYSYPKGIKFHQASRQMIGTRYQQLLDLGASLYHPYKIEKLHRARIAAKRLRYVIELFTSCLPELDYFAKEVAKLQSSLGEVHDYDEWIINLGKELKRGEVKTEEDSSKRQATFYLLERFVKARTGCYRRALKRWQQWETERFNEQL
jgi:CHAD domain-containing protein